MRPLCFWLLWFLDPLPPPTHTHSLHPSPPPAPSPWPHPHPCHPASPQVPRLLLQLGRPGEIIVSLLHWFLDLLSPPPHTHSLHHHHPPPSSLSLAPSPLLLSCTTTNIQTATTTWASWWDHCVFGCINSWTPPSPFPTPAILHHHKYPDCYYNKGSFGQIILSLLLVFATSTTTHLLTSPPPPTHHPVLLQVSELLLEVCPLPNPQLLPCILASTEIATTTRAMGWDCSAFVCNYPVTKDWVTLASSQTAHTDKTHLQCTGPTV